MHVNKEVSEIVKSRPVCKQSRGITHKKEQRVAQNLTQGNTKIHISCRRRKTSEEKHVENKSC